MQNIIMDEKTFYNNSTAIDKVKKDLMKELTLNRSSIILSNNKNFNTELLKNFSGLGWDNKLGDSKRKIAFIPSKPSSFPWLNVNQNIRFKTSYDEKKIKAIINIIGLGGYEKHFPNNLSIGFRLRISLGRAIAAGYKNICVDNPIENIQSKYLDPIYEMLSRLKSELEINLIWSTSKISDCIFGDSIFLFGNEPTELLELIDVKKDFDKSTGDFDSELTNYINSKYSKNLQIKID